MKNIVVVLFVFLFSSCSSIRMVDSWKNTEIPRFNPKKVLVIGVTENLTARKIFEDKLTSELTARGLNAAPSATVFEVNFTASKKSDEEIEKMVASLSEKGFDSVLITVVKGVDTNRSYSRPYYAVDYRWTHFGHYYYRYQDVYYNPGYYDQYKVYHIETSLYQLDAENNKSLVWVGSLDVVDPQNIRSTIKEYVSAIMTGMEKDDALGVIN